MSPPPASGHPSFLALDRAALGAGDEATRAHLETCPRCAAHVGRVQQPPPLPAWVKALPETAPASWLQRLEQRLGGQGPLRWATLAAVGAVVLTVGVRSVLVGQGTGRSGDEALLRTPYVAAKGAPVVQVVLKRGERQVAWEQGVAVKPGDVLRLRVGGSGFTHVTVAAPEAGGWQVLHSGPLGSGLETLPGAWRLDDAPRDEELLVVLGHAAVDPRELASVAETLPRTAQRWALRLVLEKSTDR